MSPQAKSLKTLLKSFNIHDGYGRLSVRTEKYSSGEYGHAYAVVKIIPQTIQDEIKNLNNFVKFRNVGNLTVVTSS